MEVLRAVLTRRLIWINAAITRPLLETRQLGETQRCGQVSVLLLSQVRQACRSLVPMADRWPRVTSPDA
jgi:hypothetical protein